MRDASRDTAIVWYDPVRGYIFRDTEKPPMPKLEAPETVEVFVRAPASEQDGAQTRGASLMFCRWRDLERLAPYETRVRRGWGVRW